MALTTARWRPRTCAVTAGAGILAHIWMLASHDHGLWMTVAALAMVAVCAPCIPGLWLHSGRTAAPARKMMVTSLGIAILHAVLLMTMDVSAAARGGHHHSDATLNGVSDETGAPAMMLMIIGIELITAFLAATVVKSCRLSRCIPNCSTTSSTPVQAELN